ncbi:MAG: Flp family type IVb pilin [Methyloligellaceae bacterium]
MNRIGTTNKRSPLSGFLRSQSGTASIEYALIVIGVSAAIIASVSAIGFTLLEPPPFAIDGQNTIKRALK